MTQVSQASTPIELRKHGSQSGGPVVVVLHGGPGAPGSAAGLAHALADHFAVLEPLQRRSGQLPLRVSRHVEDLRAVAPRPALLVGWSWGAMLGLSYAAAYPADIAGLVLVGCGTYDEKSRLLFQNALEQRLEPDEREHIAALSGKLAHESSPEARDAIFGELGAAYARVEVYDLLESDDTAEALPTDALGFRETWDDVLRLQREGIEPASFGRITAPVLMLHGADDPHPGPATRDLLRQFMPQLEYIELPRCGHEPWRERFARARFIELVRVFCERISGHGASEP